MYVDEMCFHRKGNRRHCRTLTLLPERPTHTDNTESTLAPKHFLPHSLWATFEVA